LCARLIGL
jgi:hypothetical protein